VAAGTRSPSSDPFAALGFEPSFELDLRELERRHRELSRALHPDRYAGRPASERREALGRAIEVNEAFRTLKDPIRRAEALLRKRGMELEEGHEPQPSPEFLMNIMEYREALSEARRRKNVEALARLVREIRERDAEAQKALGQAFRAGPDGEWPGAIHERLGALRYYRRFLDEAAAIEDELS
jgi:molecular chaperone HscB